MESGNGISQCMLAMADFKLIEQWNNSIEAWWEKLKSVDTVDWRNERERVLYREFSRKALKARMLRDVSERNSVLWKIGGMKPDCDISLEDGLQYAMKFGISLEQEWPLDSSVQPVGISNPSK
ncbi:hypothetical protein ACFXTI_005441 [Malus domestica]